MDSSLQNKKGLIQVYTGDGKGKTTAALGLALRATGQGMRVLFIQFVKGRISGEHRFVNRYHPFELVKLNQGDSFSQPREFLETSVRESRSRAEEALLSGKYDLVILDEIFVAFNLGLVTLEDILSLINKKPEAIELVLTGRGAPQEIIQRADLVTEMRAIKHPFQRGIAARSGIEY